MLPGRFLSPIQKAPLSLLFLLPNLLLMPFRQRTVPFFSRMSKRCGETLFRKGDRMADDWQRQLREFVHTVEQLKKYIDLSPEEEQALHSMKTTWGTTPYFASLMDRDDPTCPIRRQVIPSLKELQNRYGMQDYLIWKENRATEEQRPDSIARQYRDRVAFTVTQNCGIYCRHCFRKELVVDGDLKLDFNVDDGLDWIAAHPEVRDVLITGGDPFRPAFLRGQRGQPGGSSQRHQR
jgi:L-lysine 2,3-aminomutase